MESTITEISSVPIELEHKMEKITTLKTKTADLRKKIARQARLNLTLDSKLQHLNSKQYSEESKISNFNDKSINFNLKDLNERNTSFDKSNHPLNFSLGLKESPIEMEVKSLGNQLDLYVEELGQALASLSQHWMDQSSALAAMSIKSLKRIVPEQGIAPQHQDQGQCQGQGQGRGQVQGQGHGQFPPSLLDSFAGKVQGPSFQTPLPKEDLMSRQATDISSSVSI